MPYKVSVDVQFEAAHRLCRYEGKCHHLHGHSYKATVEATCIDLAPPGFVIDFGVLKAKLREVVDVLWDHAVILWMDDPLVPVLKDMGMNVFCMASDPTAEHMAQFLFFAMQKKLSIFAAVTSVSIMETATSVATYTHSIC